jgi:hypothetical protein
LDDARRTDVFRKRALANGGCLGTASVLSEVYLPSRQFVKLTHVDFCTAN